MENNRDKLKKCLKKKLITSDEYIAILEELANESENILDNKKNVDIPSNNIDNNELKNNEKKLDKENKETFKEQKKEKELKKESKKIGNENKETLKEQNKENELKSEQKTNKEKQEIDKLNLNEGKVNNKDIDQKEESPIDKKGFFWVLCIFLPFLAIPYIFIKKKNLSKVSKALLTSILIVYSFILFSVLSEDSKSTSRSIGFTKTVNLENYDLEKYITITISGDEKDATIKPSLNIDMLKNDYVELNGLDNIYVDEYSVEIIEFESSLMNGDIIDIPIKIYCMDSLCETKSTNIYIKKEVKGLKTLKQIKREKELAKKAAKEKRAKELAKYNKVPNYKKIARDPLKYYGNKYKMKVKVSQIVDSLSDTPLVLAYINDDLSKPVMLSFQEGVYKINIIEDDWLTIRAESNLDYTYTTVLGAENTILAFEVVTYKIS